MTKPITRLALFGAAPDTPNMGVSALFHSAIAGVAKHLDPVEFVVFDNGWGRRDTTLESTNGSIKLIRFGARGGRRYYRHDNLAAIYLASKLGSLGASLNEGIRLIDSCDAVLDVSGGDSFSDIYGRERFDNVWRPKSIAINRSKPLILLPQTYGPYKSPAVRQLAVAVVKRSDMAWARDADSYDGLKDLLGDDFDPEHHRCGVDMAFGLESRSATETLSETLRDWITNKDSNSPLVGFNVSGLIHSRPDGGIASFGFKADYRVTVEALLRELLDSTSARVILISHVMDRPGHYESDQAACIEVANRLKDRFADRIAISPATLDQSQVKWLISHMDWFCGTRMHSAIAALSSGVPTAAISYSDKTKGVFRTCGQESRVFDPRKLGSEALTRGLIDALHTRDEAWQSLQRARPRVMHILEDQFEIIANRVLQSKDDRKAT